MIHIVTKENRSLFATAILDMHCQRKELFIDELGWDLIAHDGLEIDAYDTPDAVYLIASHQPFSPPLASARLLPTVEPHLLRDAFAHLCVGEVPHSDRIWEASRFCPAPQTPKGEARRTLLAQMIAGILEAGLLFGIEEVTFVASAALTPLALGVGWDARLLGPMQRHGKERLCAMVASINAQGLANVRTKLGLKGPITRYAGSFDEPALQTTMAPGQ